MDELENLIDEFDPILQEDFINAVSDTQAELESYLAENYPSDDDNLPDENNLDQIALNKLETQLSSGFAVNLSTLGRNSQDNAILILLLASEANDISNSTEHNLNKNVKSLLLEIKNNSITDKTFKSKKDLLESVGLTTNQLNNLNNYRNELIRISKLDKPEPLPWKTLRNLSGSQRSALRKLSESGLKESDIDSLVNKQRLALLNARAKAIATTLSTQIANDAQQLVFDFALAANLIKPDQYLKYWVTRSDEKVRHNHSVTSAMNSQGVPLDSSFNSPLGPILAPPLEINCRCFVSVRVA